MQYHCALVAQFLLVVPLALVEGTCVVVIWELTMFNAYVALLRGRGRDQIHLLTQY